MIPDLPMRDRVPPFKLMKTSFLLVAAVVYLSGAVCHGQQSGSERMEETKRDWELDSLRSQAASLDLQRRRGIEQKIDGLDTQRKKQQFSEANSIDKKRMNSEIRAIEWDVRSQQNAQKREDELAANARLDERSTEIVRGREKSELVADFAEAWPFVAGVHVPTVERKKHEHFITQEQIEQARQLQDTHQFRYQSEEYWLNEIKRFNMMSEPDRRRIVDAANGTPLAFYLSLTPLARVGFRPDMLSTP